MSRWKHRLLVSALVGGALVLLLAVAVVWLLRSEAGARFALGRTQSFLGEGALSWDAQYGSLAQGLRFEGLRYRQGELVVEVERVAVRASLRSGLAARLRVESLEAHGVRVLLPPAEATESGPRFELNLPEALPSLQVSVPMEIVRADIVGLRIERIDTVETPALFEAERLSLAGALEQGRLALSLFQLEASLARVQAQGSVDTVQDWQSSVHLEGEWRAGLEAPQPFALGVEGDLQDLRLALRLPDREDFSLDLQLSEGLPRPRWVLQLVAPQPPAVLQTLWPPELADLSLQGEGGLDRAELSGGFVYGGRRYALERARLQLTGDTVQVDALQLAEGEGRAELSGWLRLPEDPAEPPRFEAELQLARFELPLAQDPPLRADGALRARGAFDDAELQLALALARDELTGEVNGGLRVEGERARLLDLELRSGAGRLALNGEVDWSAGLAWRVEAGLREFDAALLSPELASRLSAQLRSEGAEGEGLRRGELRIEGIEGELRGLPLEGSVQANWQGLPDTPDALVPIGSGSAELDLRWGSSALRGQGRLDRQLDALLELQPLQLDALGAGWAGELRGRLRLAGEPRAPRLDLQLAGPRVSLGGFELSEFTASGELGFAADAPMRLRASAAQARSEGRALGEVSLELRGSVEAHALDLRHAQGSGGLSLQLSGGWREAERRWLGRLQELDWRSPGRRGSGGDWRLAEPVAMALGADQVRVDTLCLQGFQRWNGPGFGVAGLGATADTPGSTPAPAPAPQSAGRALGSLCLDVQGSGMDNLRAQLQLDRVPVAFPMDLLMPEAVLQRPRWRGEIDGEFEFASSTGGWQVQGRLEAPEGSLRVGEGEGHELLQWTALGVNLSGDQARVQLEARGEFGGDGRLRADLVATDPGGEQAGLQGRISLLLDQLGLLEFLSQEAVIAPVGRLSAEVEIDGALLAPTLSGGVALSGFGAELPALGISPSEGRVDLRLDGGTSAELSAQFRSEGELRLRGRLDWSEAAETSLVLDIEGSDLLASDTPQVRLVASPRLQLQRRGELWRLRGEVEVPSAEIRLERFEGSYQPSADVVVLDPAEPERAVEAVVQSIDADVRIRLGDEVRLEGFGLDGTVGGELRVRDRPGRATSASGSLNVGGRYKAYGQDLEITRGRLSFAQSPIDNPGLDIRAERRIEEVTVGIQVRGTAAAPVLSLWSQPSLDQADVLSYLVLGRPVRAARGTEGQELNAAAAALGAGGNYIAERLGARLGFDQASVEDSTALGGTALMLGKFLSPRLYVAYGVALFGDGQVFSIKYLLTERWDLQVEATDRETRGSVNYRLER